MPGLCGELVRNLVAASVVASTPAAAEVLAAGSEESFDLTLQVASSCPAAAGLELRSAPADTVEQAMLAANQQLAPLPHLLRPSLACRHPTPHQSEGRRVGLDAVLFALAPISASQCSGGLTSRRTLQVTDLNGVDGLQCSGCSGASYDVQDWRDLLRVLYLGLAHDAGGAAAQRDCDSDLRRSAASAF